MARGSVLGVTGLPSNLGETPPAPPVSDKVMNNSQRTLLALGSLATIGLFSIVTSRPLDALPPPDKDVTVVNTSANPVPVTGQISVTGTSTISGSVAASQNGAWNVGAAQNGPWTVGIDPTKNTVKLAAGSNFFHDGGFSGMNDGVTVDLGPFNTSGLEQLRILGRAVNGDVRFQVLADVPPAFPITLDDFTLGGEGGSVSGTRVYDSPPPSIIIRLTESGPGGSNFHVVLAGH